MGEIVDVLLSRSDIDINTEMSPKGINCLYVAAKHGHLATVDLLLSCQDSSSKISSNGTGLLNKQRRDNGTTPLFIAAKNGHKEVVERLLEEQDIDVNLHPVVTVDGSENTPLWGAIHNCQLEVVNILLRREDVNISFKLIRYAEERFSKIHEGYGKKIINEIKTIGIRENQKNSTARSFLPPWPTDWFIKKELSSEKMQSSNIEVDVKLEDEAQEKKQLA